MIFDFGFWFLVFGFWFLVFGFWFLVFGFWFLVFGFWFLIIEILNMKNVTDENGNILRKNVQKSDYGWAATVWNGGFNGFATSVRRQHYKTRTEARNASISDRNFVYIENGAGN